MNAYEIANALKSCIEDGSTDLVCVVEAAQKLEEQADRIAELEQAFSTIFKEYKEYYEQQTTASYTINVKGGSITIGENNDKER